MYRSTLRPTQSRVNHETASARDPQSGPQGGEIGCAEDDAISRRDIDQIDIHPRPSDLPS
jgi:hypothetical protein